MNEHIAQDQDEQARRTALDVTRSMILQAPAGSGKTTVLTARYLSLLAAVDAPEEILAITFTRKAAAEMRQRVLKALHSASVGEQVTGVAPAVLQAASSRNDQRGWDILRNPTRLRIDTIDALNYWLASQLPIAARSSPGVRIAADATALYRRAARECLSQAPFEPEMARAADLVFERLDNNWKTLEDRLTEMLKERSHWLPRVLSASDDDLVQRVEAGLASSLRAALARAVSVLSPPLLQESELLLEHSLRARQLAVPQQGVRLSAEPACVGLWRQLAALALTEKGEWRKGLTVTQGFEASDKAMKLRARQWLEGLSAVPDAQARLASVSELPDHLYTPQDREALAALAKLLVRAASGLHSVFAARGQVDFSYVSGAAREALTESGEPTDLSLRTGAAIRHILVDEFQDTSLEQLELLRALIASWEPGDGRTLFVVGDPMQSIYQFREAEVGLFLQARDHGIGQIRLQALQLRRNFRSQPALIEWINEHFTRLFPAADDARLAAIRYLSSLPGPKQLEHHGDAVTVHAFNADDLGREAHSVLQVVRSAREQDSAASIAVLVAARPHAVRIVAALSAAGYPVRGVDLQPLNERAVVRDLSSLARVLLHGADRTAWLALLRSPWCGLTLAELQQLELGEHGDLFGLLQTRLAQQRDDAAARDAPMTRRLRRLCAALEPALCGSERGLPLWQRVDRCWLRLGGPGIYRSEVEGLDARRFIDALAQHDDPETLAGESLAEITRRLFSSSTLQAGAIDVMTIHAAKGLEWDIVIVPGLGRTTRPTADRLMHWIELPRPGAGTDLLLAPIRATDKEPYASLAAHIKSLRRARSKLEQVRQLYVAATRARKALHLMGGIKLPTQDRQPSPLANSLLYMLWPAVAPRFLQLFAQAPAVSSAAQVTVTASLRRLPADYEVPRVPETPAAKRLGLTSVYVSDTPEYSWVGLTARAVGTVVHAELRRLGDRCFELSGAPPDYRAWLSELGVAPAELAAAAARIRSALDKTLGDERGRWLLSHTHRETYSEWRLTGMYEGRIVNAILDRMLLDQEGQRWIIDYKTGTHEGGAVQEFVDSEAERYLPQMRRYAALAAQIDAAPVRIALYFPLLGIFRELSA